MDVGAGNDDDDDGLILSFSFSLSSYFASDNILSLADRVYKCKSFRRDFQKSWHHTKHIEQNSVFKTQQTELKF